MKKLVCLFTALFIMLSLLVSCSGDENNTTLQTDNPAESAGNSGEVTEPPTTTVISDNLPEMNFEGYNFRVYLRDLPQYNEDMYAESETGEPVNDAVYNRNRKIEERFNITIESIFYDGQDTGGTSARTLILSGEDAFDIAGVHGGGAFMLAKENLVLDWFENMPYVDFEAPWWAEDITANLSAFGKLYCMSGDISHSSLSATMCMFFNKDLFQELGIEYPYNDVINGTWTLDKFISIAKSGAGDLNGDGQITADADRYGFESYNEWGYPINVFYCGGDRVITLNNGIPELTVYNERTADIFNKFFDLMDSGSAYVRPNQDYELFESGRALFYTRSMGSIVNLRGMEAEIGILPSPKYDESAPKYYSNVDAGRNVFVVPSTSTNTERTSIIVEALSAEGYRTVLPAFYELSLKTKHARDNESAVMLDYIKESRVYDYGYFNTAMAGALAYSGQQLYMSGNPNFASFYESNAAAVQKNIDDYIAEVQ
jgi:ABC-type glycerol-3-phosphate transport system substrate-binding protein